MNEQTTEKKQYRNAPLADREYFAKPRWHDVAINEKSGNLCLTVLWDVCSAQGVAGNFDMESGVETPLPEGYDSWEAASKTYVIAFADEAQNLAKCRGKDLEFIKDICPKTYKSMKSILEWCPDWDVKRALWFTDNRDQFYSLIVRVTVVHEEWNGTVRAKVKWTNPRDRKAKEVDTTEVRGKIKSSFGGFFDVTESAPAPKSAKAATATAPAAPSAPTAQTENVPPPAPSAQSADVPPPAPPAPKKLTKSDAWVVYVKRFGATDTANWFKWIKETGKKESEFTGEDWGALAERIEEEGWPC